MNNFQNSNSEKVNDLIVRETSEAKDLLTKIGEDGELAVLITQTVLEIRQSIERGGKILVAGNGGSNAQASHLTAEFVIRYKEGEKPLPSIALGTNSTNLTACGNDLGFEEIFAREVKALGRKEDILLGFATSGVSPNILKALSAAREIGIRTVSFLGKGGGAAKDLSDIAIVVPSKTTARIQEIHNLIFHIICECLSEDRS